MKFLVIIYLWELELQDEYLTWSTVTWLKFQNAADSILAGAEYIKRYHEPANYFDLV